MAALSVGRLDGIREVVLSVYRRARILQDHDAMVSSEVRAAWARRVQDRWGLLQEQLLKDAHGDPGVQVAPCLGYAFHSASMIPGACTRGMMMDAWASTQTYWRAADSWLREAVRRRRLSSSD